MVHPSQYALHNRTPEPPVRQWKRTTRVPQHTIDRSPRMVRRPQSARPATSTRREFSLCDRPAVNEPLPTAAEIGQTAAYVDEDTAQSARSRLRVPCADDVSTTKDPRTLFRGSFAPRIGRNPDANRYDYSKHNLASSASRWGSTQGGSAEAADEATDAVTKVVLSRADDAVARIVAMGGRPHSARRPSQARERQALLRTAHYTHAELHAAVEAEEERVRRRPKPFQTTGLQGIPPVETEEHLKFADAVARDEILYKMRCNLKTEMRKKAMTTLRCNDVRNAMRRTGVKNFEAALRGQQPHAVTKATNVLAGRWKAAEEARKLEHGVHSSDSDDEGGVDGVGALTTQDRYVRSARRAAAHHEADTQRQVAARHVVSAISETLREIKGRPTDRVTKHDDDNFGPAGSCPTNTRLASSTSRKIVKGFNIIPKPPAPRLASVDDGPESSFFVTQQLGDFETTSSL